MSRKERRKEMRKITRKAMKEQGIKGKFKNCYDSLVKFLKDKK